MKKRIITTLVASVFAGAMLASNVSAMSAVGNVDVAYGTPTIDGKLSDGEWDGAGSFKVDSSTAKAWVGEIAKDFGAEVKVMWDENGLYFAGEITDSILKESSDGAYDGDAVQLSIDLGQTFFGGTESRAIFYSFGCNEKNPMVQRQESKNDAIMYNGDGVNISTVKTTKGWNFELMFKWDTLNADLEAKAGTSIRIGVGTKINVMMCYLDKDANGDFVCALGTTKSGDGVDYDWGPNDHGITLTLADKVETPVQNAESDSPRTADMTSIAVAASALTVAVLVVIRRRSH